MTDSSCTRAGYDATGRYHVRPLAVPERVNDDDQCPECRTPPGQEHADDCPACEKAPEPEETTIEVPFAVQAWMFDAIGYGAVATIVDLLASDEEEIMALAKRRLKDGFWQYRSRMYSWSPAQRRREVMEELADAIVYLTSGPVADP